MRKKQKWPKKAKLLTDGGFYKIIQLPKPILRINIPLSRKIQYLTPMTNVYDIQTMFELEFSFIGIRNGYAEFEQTNMVQRQRTI